MKFNQLFVLLTFSLLFGLVSCKNTKGDKAEVSDAGKAAVKTGEMMKVNSATSKVLWEGTKPTGAHNGTVDVTEGTVSVEGGKVTGGKFSLDMNTITVLDLEGDGKADLEGHLKGLGEGDSADHFFNVNKYPTASFEITKVTGLTGAEGANALVYGNLTMKGQTKQISFKANINVTSGAVSVETPQFTIDRTQWNVQYGSKSIFPDLKDKFINDDIGLKIMLNASK